MADVDVHCLSDLAHIAYVIASYSIVIVVGTLCISALQLASGQGGDTSLHWLRGHLMSATHCNGMDVGPTFVKASIL